MKYHGKVGKMNLPVHHNQYQRTTKVQFLTNKIPSKSYNLAFWDFYMIIFLTLSMLIYQEGGKDTCLNYGITIIFKVAIQCCLLLLINMDTLHKTYSEDSYIFLRILCTRLIHASCSITNYGRFQLLLYP